jgi:hypothetical protein
MISHTAVWRGELADKSRHCLKAHTDFSIVPSGGAAVRSDSQVYIYTHTRIRVLRHTSTVGEVLESRYYY